MKNILIILSIIYFPLVCSGQTVSAITLNGTKWENVEGLQRTMEFSVSKFTEKVSRINDTSRIVAHTRQYYISNNIPAVFDFTKVGKNTRTKGKYIVWYSEKRRMMEIDEVIYLSSDSMTLSRIFDYREIIGAHPGDKIITGYKKISTDQGRANR